MIKIEVTGASLGELADKLIAIGTSFLVSDNARIASKAARAERDAVEPEVAEVAPADPAPADPAPEAPAPEAPVVEAPVVEAPALSFEKDVAPVVLRAVATKGKPYVEGVMTEFGVVRASQLDAARWAELIERLEADA